MQKFNFFSCLGLDDLSSLEKERLQKEIEDVIWGKFILIGTVKLLSFEERKLLSNLVEQKAQKDTIQHFLNSKVNNFSQEYAAFAQKVEVEIINDHIANLITETIQVISLIKDNKKKEKLEEKLKRYKKALEYCRGYEWKKVDKELKQGELKR